MNKNRLKMEKGFTLIEILIAATIFATFLAISSNSLVDVLKLEQKANVLRKTQQNTRYILESIIREARNANGEFIKNGQAKERVTSSYQFGSSGQLILTNTDLEAGKVTEKIYYKDGEIIRMDTLSKSMGASIFTTESAGIALNKTEDLRIIKFDFNGSAFYSDIDLPPILYVNIEAQSGEGLDAKKPELRAHTTLASSATPRGY